MLGRGSIGGRRVVSESWVAQSTTADADYLRPRPAGPGSPPRYGYGFQWWIPPGDDGAFMAIGIYGQAIYVNPARQIVIVQTSAWPTPVDLGPLSAAQSATFAAIATSR